MLRVLRPGGRLAVAVCDAVERSPGYGELAAMLDRLFGRAVGDAFRAPFALGDPERLRAIFVAGGAPDAAVARRDGTVRFASIAAMISTERACVWTLGGLLDDAQFARLLAEAEQQARPLRAARRQRGVRDAGADRHRDAGLNTLSGRLNWASGAGANSARVNNDLDRLERVWKAAGKRPYEIAGIERFLL